MKGLDIKEATEAINASTSINILENIKVKYFGKKGIFVDLLKNISNLSLEEKKLMGNTINQQKDLLDNLIKEKFLQLKNIEINQQIALEGIDLSLNSHTDHKGGIHPITATISQIVAIFGQLGYKVAHAKEIESDWYNFTALNIPLHHPSRQNHDTFYLNCTDDKNKPKLLRTHTSNTQIHAMEELANKKEFSPLKVIAPGKTYRSDSDATHSPMFHQFEVLHVNYATEISIPKLKALLTYFLTTFFNNNNIKLRFRPSYFPFTSPSFEVDIQYKKTANGLIMGEGDDWLEVLGCGIVNNNVIKNCGLDFTKYKGFALGAGIERLAMLKYNFKDLRAFFENDYRWLTYYNFGANYYPTVFGGL